MTKLSAQWTRLHEAEILQRSSQILSIINNKAYIFGGELRPREPRDNDLHILSFEGDNKPTLTTTASSTSTTPTPSPRVGTAATTLHNNLYLFSGRGGTAMAPIDEEGGIWEYSPSSKTWTLLLPQPTGSGSPHPAARSYHCLTSDGRDTIYLHAGCPASGRLSDLWAFSVSRREWTQLASAPDPARGGTSIACVDGKVYRMNGFDGQKEQGGCVDVYSREEDRWRTVVYEADGVQGPAARSVAALLGVKVDGGLYLVTLFGERDPSSLGHQGAGKMLGDVWAFDVEGERWVEVETGGEERPDARGWFDADVLGEKTVVVQGGLGELNNRLGDVWSLRF